ncbi:transcriptional regulator [Nonlabens spongiae]|uniref:Transcriptional regulator n=1 Tax=Nonlabens spongiae TaxID=331648 RepID=A0A1W6MI06_9FLAO|nr:GntR family transcriptional regulator [Nonlabens spongiae]ARN77254.1 transcriptional regulator [Nonlabens spongiae]
MGIINVDSNIGVPKYKQIIQSVEQALLQGQLKKGDKLPSINSISGKFSLSRDTVLVAFAELKKRGVIASKAGKGYYINKEDITVTKKIFLLFDELNIFKEDLYNAFIESLGEEVQVDIFFHHFNTTVFHKHINDNLDNYHHYVIMPAGLPEIDQILKKLPQDEVYLLDQSHQDLSNYSGVFQNFYKNVLDGLGQLLQNVSVYNELILIKPKSYQPEGIFKGFHDFITQSRIRGRQINFKDQWDVQEGKVYFVLDDRSLIELIQKIKATDLEIGKSVGIIAYNDSMLKEVVEGGITTISTNFKEMGYRMAKMVLNSEKGSIENTNRILLRESL